MSKLGLIIFSSPFVRIGWTVVHFGVMSPRIKAYNAIPYLTTSFKSMGLVYPTLQLMSLYSLSASMHCSLMSFSLTSAGTLRKAMFVSLLISFISS